MYPVNLSLLTFLDKGGADNNNSVDVIKSPGIMYIRKMKNLEYFTLRIFYNTRNHKTYQKQIKLCGLILHCVNGWK